MAEHDDNTSEFKLTSPPASRTEERKMRMAALEEIRKSLPKTDPSTALCSGIYLIRCIPSSKVYVGSAVDLKRRWREHASLLKHGNHQNEYLQRAWSKHGSDAFSWDVLEYVAIDQLLTREQFHIDAFDASNPSRGFNILPLAGSPLGFRHTEEARQRMAEIAKARPPMNSVVRAKISATLRGNSPSPEARAKISYANRGRVVSEETKAKLAAASASRKYSPVHMARRSAAQKGKVFSAATRAKISATKTGVAMPPEVRAKISATMKGSKQTPEHAANVSAALRGKPFTEEHRLKLVEAWKRRKARKLLKGTDS